MENNMDYYRIGETFTFKGTELTVEERSNIMNCRDCYFYYHDCKKIPCKADERKDGKNIYFDAGDEPCDFPYHPIGEEFQFRGVTLRVCTYGNLTSLCSTCYFKGLDCARIPCMAARRADREDVSFVRIDED